MNDKKLQSKAGALVALLDKGQRRQKVYDSLVYIEISVEGEIIKTLGLDPLQEGKWRHSGVQDWYYRVDPPNPSMSINRHIHLARKKHLTAPDKQYSWHDDGTRHDTRKFPGKVEKTTKSLARKILNLGDDVIIEAVYAVSMPELEMILEYESKLI